VTVDDVDLPDDRELRALRLARLGLDHVGLGMLYLALDGRIVDANAHACDKLGYPSAELCRLRIFDVNPTLTAEGWQDHIQRFVGRAEPRVFESVHRRKSGVTFPVEVTVRYLRHGDEDFFLASVRDLTDQRLAEAERARLEEQLAHAQRMESIGRLAGGIAHDFNNMLSVILGHVDLLSEQLEEGSPLVDDVEGIRHAATRSAELTRQLLGFARRQTIAPRVLDPNPVIESTVKMLRRSAGAKVQLTFQPAAGLWPIQMDPAQLDQVLLNLTVNAIDAIAGEGTVAIQTKNLAVDAPAHAPHRGLPAGSWVALTVRDTGTGMDERTLAHVFEPFFTTKPVGEGTGLGLSTVFGIVRQNEGHVFAESAPGAGSTFTVYLPRHAGAPASPAPRVVRDVEPVGAGTVLLVEDEPQVLRLTRGLLDTLGYTVLATGSPEEALALAQQHDLQLVLTDVVMPGMNGRELARKVRALQPVGVVLMSGYAAGLTQDLEPHERFLQKPLMRNELALALRSALQARHG
jgi:two-component system cell cycle sensor histidine kinase/response regulator CckA